MKCDFLLVPIQAACQLAHYQNYLHQYEASTWRHEVDCAAVVPSEVAAAGIAVDSDAADVVAAGTGA